MEYKEIKQFDLRRVHRFNAALIWGIATMLFGQNLIYTQGSSFTYGLVLWHH